MAIAHSQDFDAFLAEVKAQVGDHAAEDLRPKAPHDALPFAELEQAYNFSNTKAESGVFTRLLLRECWRIRQETGQAPTVLDVGCGQGISLVKHFTLALRLAVGEFWGVEPDPKMTELSQTFDHLQHALLEDADLPENHFDLSYSSLVMEHVEHPDAYLKAIARSLKPGGVHLFLTPNARHYFARIASTLHALKLDEFVLRLTRPGDVVDDYHYPIRYRCNSSKQVRALATATGFDDARFVFVENLGPAPYMPGPLRLGYHAMRAKRRWMRNPESLMLLIARLEKR